MKPIAIFYHSVFKQENGGAYPMSIPIIFEQFSLVKSSGLEAAADLIVCGINGSPQDSEAAAKSVFPEKAQLIYHGLSSRAENLTIVEIEKWVPNNPGWNVIYFHSKSATHWPGTHYGENVAGPWRRTMMKHLVTNWKTCVADLESGYEMVGCHAMIGVADGTQNIWPGNFWWATSDFLATVPSIYLRDRIKVSGIAALESRFEAEVWAMNGKIPKFKDVLPTGGGGVP